MMPDDAAMFDRSVARINKAIFAVGAGGAILALAWGGWSWGAGFAFGSALSWVNFRWLARIVNAMGPQARRRRLSPILGLRYLLLGGAGYVILRYSKIDLRAMLAGLFVTLVAVTLEIVIQLVYARKRNLDHPDL